MKAGLRTKMLAPVIGVVVVCMGLSAYLSAQRSSSVLWEELVGSSKRHAQSVSGALGMFTEDIRGAVVLQSKNPNIQRIFADAAAGRLNASEALVDLTRFDPSIQSANLLDARGDVMASSDPAAKGNFSDRDYFKMAMQGKPAISEPIISRVTNKPVFLTAAPVTIDGKTTGVLYVRVDLGKFSETMVDPVKVGQNGYAYLIDKSGVVVSHPDKSLILKLKVADYDWGRKLLAQDSGTVEYEFNGQRATAIFQKDPTTGWTAVVTINPSDIAQAASAVRNAGLLVGLGGAILASAVTALVLGAVLKTLGRCVDFAKAVADGNLSQSLTLARKDELGVLAASLNVMVNALRERIAAAQSKTLEAEQKTQLAESAMREANEAKARAQRAKSEGMLQAATRLEGVVQFVNAASKELNNRIDGATRGAEAQAQRITETAAAMEEMNAAVLEVARNSSDSAEVTQTAAGKAKEGAGVVGKVVESIGRVRDQAENLKADMGRLGREAQDIGRILNVISDIADQTNLLALNAAIEAARAGEAGRGFAVVADEVRKLAEKTMAATREVDDAIQGVQRGAKLNVDNVDKAAEATIEATRLAADSGRTLSEIVTLVESASDQVRSIATAAEEQSASSEEINRSVDQVHTISLSTSETMAEAARTVADLARQAQALKSLMEELEREGRAALEG